MTKEERAVLRAEENKAANKRAEEQLRRTTGEQFERGKLSAKEQRKLQQQRGAEKQFESKGNLTSTGAEKSLRGKSGNFICFQTAFLLYPPDFSSVLLCCPFKLYSCAVSFAATEEVEFENGE